MKVLFTRSHTVSSWLIRFATWSRFSHCAVLDGDWVIESTFFGGGVHERPLASFAADHPDYVVVDIPCPDDEAGLQWARSQVGKPYDWTAVLSFLVRRNWQEDDSWFCSEFCESALLHAGRNRFRVPVWRVTPQYVWMLT